jgi:hypothetical protein
MTPATQSTNLENTARHRQGYAGGWLLVGLAMVKIYLGLPVGFSRNPFALVYLIFLDPINFGPLFLWGLLGTAAALRQPWGWYVLVVTGASGCGFFLILGVFILVGGIGAGFYFVAFIPPILAWFIYFYKRRVMFGAKKRWQWFERNFPDFVGPEEDSSPTQVRLPNQEHTSKEQPTEQERTPGGDMAQRQAPVSRKYLHIALRLAIFTALFAALVIANLYEAGRPVTGLIITAGFILAFCLMRGRRLRVGIIVLAIPIFWIMGAFFLMTRPGYVSFSAPSPDSRVVAEIYEPPKFIDRNFVVRLTTKNRWGIPQYKRLFVSPDEGWPPTERLLWSKDGRYLLLLGKSISTISIESCLDSGECLYLLVDTEQDIVYSNASQLRERRPFSVNDLSGIEFGESFTSLSQ